MKVLLITQEPPLRRDEVVSGNAVRTLQLTTALEQGGHEVHQAWLGGSFDNRDELQGVLLREQPGAVLVGYWELLGLLPLEPSCPVILDFVAPRPLEELFESPDSAASSLRRLRLNLQRCDLLLVGNEKQETLMLHTLIESGFDLREGVPVRRVPLGGEVVGAPATEPGVEGWRLVGGGVSWPWRDSSAYRRELDAFIEGREGQIGIVEFGGRYRWHGGEDTAPPVTDREELRSYEAYSGFLHGQGHVGVELADRNAEREHSQSFRSLEFLRHGLPVLCNSFLPIAHLVREYDAGWLVEGPDELGPVLEKMLADPGAWRAKSDNALRLAHERLSPAASCRPLLKWLDSPARAARLPRQQVSREQPPVLGVPPLGQRIKRQFSLAKTVLLRRLFSRPAADGVVIVTRSDLFPPDHGAAVRTVETARALARLGNRVAIVTDERNRWHEVTADGVTAHRCPWWMRLLALPGPLVKLLHFTKDIPHSNAFLYLPLSDGSFFWRVLAAGRAVGAGVLQAEFPAYASPCIEAREILGCPVVLVQHNVEYDRLQAQVAELSEPQYENLKAIEIDLCNRVDAVVCVSDNDRQKLGEDGVHPDQMHTIPHGVDLAQFDELDPIDARQRFGIPDSALLIVYHGTFSYPPNREALKIFAEILLPGLEAKGLECHLLAVGRDAPAKPPHPRIHCTGSVEQVGPWLSAADLSLVPLIEGGGTRMKIIDCFAARLPVISTSKGIEGIPVVHGRHALVLDDWDEIIAAVMDLHERPERAAELAAAGRALADGLDWKEIGRAYRGLYARLG